MDELETIGTYCKVGTGTQTTERFCPGQMEDDILGLNQVSANDSLGPRNDKE